jgi:UDP-glucose:(heptosyl)LPS alpha-1,3-glucosyltransferase
MSCTLLLKPSSKTPGGLEKYAERIRQAFIEKGSKVVTLEPKDAHLKAWPNFIRLEQFDRFAQNFIKKHKPDLIFGMERNRFQTHLRAGNGVHAAYLKTRSPLKAFFSKFNPLHQKILELEKAGFENPLLQKLFTNSYMVKDQVLQYYNVDPSKIKVIHNGVEWEEMQGDFDAWEAKRESILQKLKLNPSHFHFLFIGNGFLRKGLDPLLKALAMLQNKEVHLCVVGKDKNLPLYQHKLDQLGLTHQVRFFGMSQEVRTFYQMADALVIPSFYDPFANVTLEALAMGLWVTSSKTNGAHEILNPTNGNIIEDLVHVDAITNALKLALKHPKTKISSINTRLSVKHLSFSKQLATLMDFCG